MGSVIPMVPPPTKSRALSHTALFTSLLVLASCRTGGELLLVQDTGGRVETGSGQDAGFALDRPVFSDTTLSDTGTFDSAVRDAPVRDAPVRDATGDAITDRATPTDNPITVDAPPRDVVAVTDAPPGPVLPDTVRFTGTLGAASGERTQRLTVGGSSREMLVHIPSSRPAHPPLIVLFHGTNDSPDAIFSESAVRDVSDANGVIAIGPSARDQTVSDWDHPDQEGRWWSTSPAIDPDTNPDLLLLRAIIAAAVRDLGVDPDRVYLIGHSNGAFFAQLAAMTLNDRIAAWASSSGGLCNCRVRPDCMFMGSGTTCAVLSTRPGWCSCSGPDQPGPINTRGRRPPAWITHGSGDDIVSVYYSCALSSRLTAAGYDTRVVIRNGEQHVMPDRFAETVWPWLSARRRQ